MRVPEASHTGPQVVPNLPVVTLAGDAGRDRLADSEWLLTNGIGGFAMGTASGLPTRRYHGLLVAAMSPPVQREVMLHSFVESVVLEPGTERERMVDLSCYCFGGGYDHPRGDELLARFEKGPTFCRWAWRAENVEVIKTLRLAHGRNAAAVQYQIAPGVGLVRLQLRPLVAMRDSHHLMHKPGAEWAFSVEAAQRRALIQRGTRMLELACDLGWFQEDHQWWYNFEYAHEVDRGLDSREDLFSPGVFSLQVRPGPTQTLTMSATVDGMSGSIADEESQQRAKLRGLVVAALSGVHASASEEDRRGIVRLAVASDDFVVRRGAGPDAGISVIAGYPWFSDWGRDTAISLPGLFLTTRRIDEARKVLETFAKHRRRGLIPNLFNDSTGEAEYNTVDASLWYVHAACEWLKASGDRAGFDGEIGAACLEIVDSYRDGTDFAIGMDPADGVIAAGDPSTQLTWMDAKRDGIVFTPRHGKAVEINALWIHGLRSLAKAMAESDKARAAAMRATADRAARSFLVAFWNPSAKCLYDVLIPAGKAAWKPDARIRPNQIFAASLEHSPLSLAQRRAVVNVVKERLLTPAGLRTLDPADPGYKPRFAGPMRERDAAYHNGTVWPWLMGAYVEAVLRAGEFSAAAKEEAAAAVRPLVAMLDDKSLGQLPEVFDAEGSPDRPRRPGGCIAQAWSVAETLRAIALLSAK